MNKTELENEEILMRHINTNSSKKQDIEQNVGSVRKKVEHINSHDEDKYHEIPLKELPCAKFYPNGTHIYIRSATTKEIQAYSIVDNTNRYDITQKMNAMLEKNVLIKNHLGQEFNYKHLYDLDRLIIIILISRLTRKDKKVLTKDVKCSCGLDLTIEYTPQHFKYNTEDEEILEFFDPVTKTYKLPFITEDIYLCPPKIGIQIDIYNYMLDKSLKNNELNVPLMKIVPYVFDWSEEIDIEKMKEIEFDFETMDDDKFQFLNDAVSKITLGVSELVKKCSCGKEVHTDFSFPGGASSIFIVPNAFRKFIRK